MKDQHIPTIAKITRQDLQQLEQACGPDTVAYIEIAAGGYHIGCEAADGMRKVTKNIDHAELLTAQQQGTWPDLWAKFCAGMAKTYNAGK